MLRHRIRVAATLLAALLVWAAAEVRAEETPALRDVADAVRLIEAGRLDVAEARFAWIRERAQSAAAPGLLATVGLVKIELMKGNYPRVAGLVEAYAAQAKTLTPPPADLTLPEVLLAPGIELAVVHLLDGNLAAARETLRGVWTQIEGLKGLIAKDTWALTAGAFLSAHVAYLMQTGEWAVDGWDDALTAERIDANFDGNPILAVVYMKTVNALRSLSVARRNDLNGAERLAQAILDTPMVKAMGSIAALEFHVGCIQAVRGEMAAAADSLERAVAAAERSGGRIHLSSLIRAMRASPADVKWPENLDPRSKAYALGVIPRVRVILKVEQRGGALSIHHAIDYTFDIDFLG